MRVASLLAVLAVLAVVAGCTASEAEPNSTAQQQAGAAPTGGVGSVASAAPDSSRRSASADSGAAARPPSAPAGPRSSSASASGRLTPADVPVVRGLYVNRWAAQSAARMRSLIAIADSTEINGFVIDLKDEFGLNYASADSLVRRNAGNGGTIPRLGALLDTLHAHGILPIARIVVFKDSVAARVNAGHTIRRPDGGAWRDKEGLAWVNPYDREIWEYNIRVAEEAVRLGFPEIQFDYIRFPEPYASLPKQVFPGAEPGLTKPKVLAAFLDEACGRIRKLGGRCTADIFGLVTTVPGALEIGQSWEELARVTDVLLPMVYPSHYPRGAFGLDRPNAQPYEVIKTAIARARERNEALGLPAGEQVRPWLQAFSLGQPPYEAHHVREQIRGVYDAGYRGWILWHPGTKYGPFLAALEAKRD
ncbi:MAG TPA: putative glycoside hydrolase [Gemmatimonadaceae bacterium]|nr:putative glycoside hydrolase [Gemmatimonadaceae bacterium]